MKGIVERSRGERGAMLVQGAIIFLGLLAVTTFVVDYGMLWVARHQAQNSADAAALAGAASLAYDSMQDRSNSGPAKQAALRLALVNTVIGQSPNINVNDITFPQCPDDGTWRCIRVNVYRNEQRGNPLPMIFGRIVGLGAHGVRATATAKAAVGNASNCLKPWVIPDRWQENSSPVNATFDKYVKNGNTISTIPNPDEYIPSVKDVTMGSGYNTENDLGSLLTLKAGGPSEAIQPGWYYPIDLPLPPDGGFVPGGDQYRTNIFNCTSWPVGVGDTVVAENGNMVGPTAQGVRELIALDPYATWNTETKTVENSCAQARINPCGPISPRSVAIAMVDPDALSKSMLETGGKNITLRVVNILGFFINSMDGGGAVTGYLTPIPGLSTGQPINDGSAFTIQVMLVR